MGTEKEHSYFQCRILIDTGGGSTSLQNGQCPSLAGLKDSVEGWCVYECVWTSGNELMYSAEWIIL